MNNKGSHFIAYIIHKHPSLRTTFIRREIDSLRAKGIRIEVFSMRPCDSNALMDDTNAVMHIKNTHYLSDNPLALDYFFSNIKNIMCSPLESLYNACIVCHAPGKGGRLRHIIHLWRTALLAEHIRSMGNCRHIHTHFTEGAATTAMAVARLLGAGFSFTSHTSWRPSALKKKMREAHFIASISQYDKQELLRNFKSVDRDEIAKKIHIIHCSLPIGEWPFSPKDRVMGKTSSNPPIILSVGALEEKKGHDVLIRACGILRDQGVRFQCRIVGGFAGVNLHPIVTELRLKDSVVLTGPLSQRSVRDELLNCDVYTLACRRSANGNSDGVPVSLMEAMAIGRLVVSTCVAGIPELVVDGETGLLVEPDDPDALAEKLRSVLERKQNIDEISCRARKHVEINYNIDIEATKLKCLFMSKVDI